MTKRKHKSDLRNCENCRHLEWGFGDVGDPEGWVCEKRSPLLYGKAEHALLEKLDSDAYRAKAKVCFEPRYAICPLLSGVTLKYLAGAISDQVSALHSEENGQI